MSLPKRRWTLEDLTLPVSAHADLRSLLTHWQWLISEPEQWQAGLYTRMGDVFMVHQPSGQIYFLDVMDGELERIADNAAAFEALLKDDEFVMDYFSSDLVLPLSESELPPDHIVTSEKPLVLGGVMEPKTLVLVSLKQYMDQMGRLWEELAQLRPDEGASTVAGD